ncbi:uncharacterized protein MKK02DRAFT_30174 [Dioszegia hungarica]|uniref:Uncharacterized protein n=1 Tax=Dioszegia hungarica TaxID=4972 RepID=A0AA38H4G2_9TREE|nr:uncharacterized protein MKK02DRAFT_30174 [Dioszegia hungarica]KAI9632334.1 hypothetical protein MKK02DRAFT_30174 [Dioszegia hungarica]
MTMSEIKAALVERSLTARWLSRSDASDLKEAEDALIASWTDAGYDMDVHESQIIEDFASMKQVEPSIGTQILVYRDTSSSADNEPIVAVGILAPHKLSPTRADYLKSRPAPEYAAYPGTMCLDWLGVKSEYRNRKDHIGSLMLQHLISESHHAGYDFRCETVEGADRTYYTGRHGLSHVDSDSSDTGHPVFYALRPPCCATASMAPKSGTFGHAHTDTG